MITVDKLLLIPVLFALGCLCAGLYGIIHNQISYTVSLEYFTQYKFHQFGISEDIPQRLGAAIVGWQASWWMGIVIGSFVIPCGLLIPGTRQFFGGTFRAFLVVAATAMIVGLSGLLLAWLTVDPETVQQVVKYRNEIADDVAFVRAGSMHNLSYIGGVAGIIAGCISILRYRHRVYSTRPGND